MGLIVYLYCYLWKRLASSEIHLSIYNSIPKFVYQFVALTSTMVKKNDQPTIPDDVLHKLSCLIASNPNGILSDHLSKSYLKMFGVPLDFKALGFSKLKAFLEACPNILEMRERKSDGLILYPPMLPKGN